MFIVSWILTFANNIQNKTTAFTVAEFLILINVFPAYLSREYSEFINLLSDVRFVEATEAA